MMSVADLNRFLIVALYLPVCLFAYWRLIPRLSPVSKRLATFMLFAQLLVIALSTELSKQSGVQGWLWHLDQEHNIPATLASAQLALVGFVSLLTAWLSKARSPWHRVFSAGLGLILIHLARDEFFLFHESGLRWQVSFAQFGVAVALATALSATRLPRRLRIWHLCILAGLATGAAGTLVIDVIQWNGQCINSIFFTSRCEIYVLEESLEFLGMWLVLLGILGLFSDAAPRFSRRWRMLYLLPILWAIIHHVPFLISLAEFNSISLRSAIVYEDDSLELRIYRVEQDRDSISLQFFAVPRTWHHYTDIGYSLHLVDQVSGGSYLGLDVAGSRKQTIPYRFLDHRYIYKQLLQLDLPSQPRNRALWIVLTTVKKQDDEFLRQRIISSDFPLLSENQVKLGELVFQQEAELAAISPIATFENGMSIVNAEFSERARAGDLIPIRFAWSSDRPVNEDYAQFLHIGHEASGDWRVFDQLPLGARLPTRLWYGGMADSESWQLSLPADMASGQYSLYTGLYRISDSERLPASAREGTPFVDARIPLGSLTIESP